MAYCVYMVGGLDVGLLIAIDVHQIRKEPTVLAFLIPYVCV